MSVAAHRLGVNELRALRYATGFGQREFAALLAVPEETLRTWDSGRRSVPLHFLYQARTAVARHRRQHELLPLAALARELSVPLRTLQAAVRTGRARSSGPLSQAIPDVIRLQ